MIHCDGTLTGSTTGFDNLLEDYACTWGSAPGPEVGFAFYSMEDDFLQVTLMGIGFGVDVTLYVSEGACAEASCIEYAGTGQLQLETDKGQTYYLIVESETFDTAGSFVLSVVCQSTCEPACEGKKCGEDGCMGTCGECEEGLYCVESQCVLQDGCVVTDEPGCAGCPCEDCVCDMWPECCWWGWDAYCVMFCEDGCGGCADLSACGNDACDEQNGEDCHNCPDDCLCPEGEQCYNGACCKPDCSGVECGDDGCGGNCGDCPDGLFCVDGACGSNDGCIETAEPGCGGCLCAECVCDMWPECCIWAWDSFCVMFCDAFCEGCGSLTSCGDAFCDATVGENCANCPGDCACPEPEVCYQSTCCAPDCAGKECGPDGCGGSCGECPCPGCDPESDYCDATGLCVVFDGYSCQEYVFCLMDCDDYDYYCADECESLVDSAALEAYDAWNDCLEIHGYYDCWEWDCVDAAYSACLEAGFTCMQGTESCPAAHECMMDCVGAGADDCASGCFWSGTLETLELYWEVWSCILELCYEMSATSCILGALETTCAAALDECLDAECPPNCEGKECGDDGCGASCGSCAPGVPCIDGQCSCAPKCEGKECGPDGCGGQCGKCPAGEYCSADFECLPHEQIEPVVELEDLMQQPDVPEEVHDDNGQPEIVETIGEVDVALVAPDTPAKDYSHAPVETVGQQDLATDDLEEADAAMADPGQKAGASCGSCTTRPPAGTEGSFLLLCLALLACMALRLRGEPPRTIRRQSVPQ